MDLKQTPVTENYSYPGNYVPVPAFYIPDRKSNARIRTNEIFINVKDRADMLRIELTIPGLQRECFQIKLKDQHVLIQVFFTESASTAQTLNPKNRLAFSKEFYLPHNIDAGYGSAIYNDGKLQLCFPKTRHIHLTEVDQLVVY